MRRASVDSASAFLPQLLERAVRVRQRIRYGTMRISIVQTEFDPVSGLMAGHSARLQE